MTLRRVEKINPSWKFIKKDVGAIDAITALGEMVHLPHTWNAIDGQDGGNDYYRGTCWYVKELSKPDLEDNDQIYLEFRGANSSTQVWVNGENLTTHHGGYSTFRVNITDVLQEQNTIVVGVDNAPNNYVYPQKADFTFYGGIYRDVYMVIVKKAHFDLDYFGGNGLQITSQLEGSSAIATCKAYVSGGDMVHFTIEGVGSIDCPVEDNIATGQITIPNAHLWDGVKDPYLYKVKAQLMLKDYITDEIESPFGCRSFAFDADKGFILNGHVYPLRGVSRHQDRRGVGNAITKEMMKEDMDILKEIGANTVRLAHYQHDQYFYDLCDQEGIIVWAEIPYITEHLPAGRDNTVSQLKELIAQNYNHPSIVCWGLSNEITVTGISDDLRENHTILNDLAHGMDPSRPTSMAHVFMLDIDDPLVFLPDIMSYNLYYGWYLGELSFNDEWFDTFKAKYPDKIVGLSEYGADANPKWQTGTPEKGDYTEMYQGVYHEHMLRMFDEKPYLWATHVWNLFDFGADGRDEGGENGVNQKGLVTFDRKHKKDAFYLYKAYWSKDPFIHICGKNYNDRHEDETQIKIYSNQNNVELYDNGTLIGKQQGSKVFVFQLKLQGEHTIEAKSGTLSDTLSIRKVAEKNKEYLLLQTNIHNWFDDPEMGSPEGFYSIKDTMGSIKQSPIGAALIEKMMDAAKAKRGDVAQGVQKSAAMEKMMDAMTVEALIKQAGGSITPEMTLELNKALNKIEKINHSS